MDTPWTGNNGKKAYLRATFQRCFDPMWHVERIFFTKPYILGIDYNSSLVGNLREMTSMHFFPENKLLSRYFLDWLQAGHENILSRNDIKVFTLPFPEVVVNMIAFQARDCTNMPGGRSTYAYKHMHTNAY